MKAWCDACQKETTRYVKSGDCRSCVLRSAYTPERRERMREIGRACFAKHGSPMHRMTPEARSARARLGAASRTARLGTNRWGGDAVVYRSAHNRVERERGKATEHACIDCGEQAAHWSFDEITGFSPDPSRYSPRCVPCHHRHDQIVERRGGRAVATGT